MEYRFFDISDEKLIETSELPTEGGIAVAIRTTGYDIETDEVVEIAIVDLEGEELLSHVVKPQNKEEWDDVEASGGITPDDVTDAPELFQFEDEIIELFENASVVVSSHTGFVKSLIEGSWVSLPQFIGFDLVERFRESHCTTDYSDQPATVANPSVIAGYYGVELPDEPLSGKARAAALCYKELVEEHKRQRQDKGEQHWRRYREKLEEAERNDANLQNAKRIEELKAARLNAVLWLCGAAIFSNVAVQMHLRDFEPSLVIIMAVAAVFTAVRWGMCMYQMYRLRPPK